MDFTFDDDQYMFRDSAREFLSKELNAEIIRASWETDTGRSDELWMQLAELGLTAMLVPEDYDGLGLNEVDTVLVAEECGYAALHEPLIENVLVAAPLLSSIEDESFKAKWLSKLAGGEARVAVAHSENDFIADAHVADLILLQDGEAVYALEAGQVNLVAESSVDPSRRIFRMNYEQGDAQCVARGELARTLADDMLNRGALGAAAQCLGVAQRMIEQSVQYTSERKQFGKPVGSFQAVKHHMANVAVRLEFARAPVYRAAFSLAEQHPLVNLHISQAKIAAAEAALLAAKNSIQVHGAMGYTWEMDLHIWMKRAWVLDKTWGDSGFHKERVSQYIFKENIKLGAGNTF